MEFNFRDQQGLLAVLRRNFTTLGPFDMANVDLGMHQRILLEQSILHGSGLGLVLNAVLRSSPFSVFLLSSRSVPLFLSALRPVSVTAPFVLPVRPRSRTGGSVLPPSSIAVPGVGLGCPRATAISIAVSSGGLLAADSQKPSWGLLPRSISLADLHTVTLSRLLRRKGILQFNNQVRLVDGV